LKKRLVLDFLTYTKLYKLFRPFYGGLGQIIALHRIIPKGPIPKYVNEDIELSPEELESSIRFFRDHGYTPVSLNEVYDILTGKRNINKFVAFTIDDGYVDTYNYAYHIFNKYDIPFAINLTTDMPDGRIIMWWYFIEDLLLKNDRISFVMNNEEVIFKCRSPLEKYHVSNKLRAYILDSDAESYKRKLQELFEPYVTNHYDLTNKLAISWEMIKKMSHDPKVTIASHSVSHRPFHKLSPEKIRWEITKSIEIIEQQISKKVEHFSYPFGQMNRLGKDIIKELGLKTATTTRFHNIFKEHREHLHCLPRVFKLELMPKVKYLGVTTSGAYAALRDRFKRIIK